MRIMSVRLIYILSLTDPTSLSNLFVDNSMKWIIGNRQLNENRLSGSRNVIITLTQLSAWFWHQW